MRKVIKPVIKFKYIGGETPEKQKESEIRLQSAYNRIFNEALKRLRILKK